LTGPGPGFSGQRKWSGAVVRKSLLWKLMRPNMTGRDFFAHIFLLNVETKSRLNHKKELRTDQSYNSDYFGGLKFENIEVLKSEISTLIYT